MSCSNIKTMPNIKCGDFTSNPVKGSTCDKFISRAMLVFGYTRQQAADLYGHIRFVQGININI